MKKRLLPALSFGVAFLVIGSVVYAADRRKNSKTSERLGDKACDESLKAEMMTALDIHKQNPKAPSQKTDSVSKTHMTDKESALLAEVTKKNDTEAKQEE